MAASSFLGGTPASEPWRNIVAKSLTVEKLVTTSAVDVSTKALVTFSASSGGTFLPTAAQLFGNLFYYSGAGAVNFSLPTVASVTAYLATLGITAATGTSFTFDLMNQQIPTGVGAVSIISADVNWSTSVATPTLAIGPNSWNNVVCRYISGTTIGVFTGGEAVPNYATGLFTPVLTFGGGVSGITYGAQVGRYTRIGDTVTVQMSIVLTNKGIDIGAAVITGLPFGSSSIPGVFTTSWSLINFAAAIPPPINTYITGTTVSATTIDLMIASADGAASAVLTDASFANTSTINISGTYFVV
jgi:hypothetical protein